MEVLSLLADGFATSLSPFNLFIVIIGVTAGLFIGAMPGLGSVNGVAIVLPLTFIVPPSSAIILWLPSIMGRCMGARSLQSYLGYLVPRRLWRQPLTDGPWRKRGRRVWP